MMSPSQRKRARERALLVNHREPVPAAAFVDYILRRCWEPEMVAIDVMHAAAESAIKHGGLRSAYDPKNPYA